MIDKLLPTQRMFSLMTFSRILRIVCILPENRFFRYNSMSLSQQLASMLTLSSSPSLLFYRSTRDRNNVSKAWSWETDCRRIPQQVYSLNEGKNTKCGWESMKTPRPTSVSGPIVFLSQHFVKLIVFRDRNDAHRQKIIAVTRQLIRLMWFNTKINLLHVAGRW